ncbi:MAG: anti-sigma factor family protein, partial [Acidobacteriota bacterium]
ISDRFSHYLDGELAPQGVQEVEEHLEDCASCRRELALLHEVKRMLGSAVAVPNTPDQWPRIRRSLRERVFGALHPLSQSQETVQSHGWKRWIPAAAAILVLLGVTLFWPFGPDYSTDVEPYLGLYLLAGTADDVLSSKASPEEVEALGLDFVTYLPPAVNGWRRQAVYIHRLHGQPVLQTFYAEAAGRHYCIFQQSSRHSLDFGNREVQQEFVRNQVCTKFADRHFNLISWRSDRTLFTVVSTADTIDLNQIAGQWIKEIE